MSLLKRRSLSFFVVVIFFLISAQSIDWQGYGNMSSSNLTTIWGFINPRITTVAQNVHASRANPQSNLVGTLYAGFATDFSNYLNEEYNPAWNVFVISTVAGKDSILYGYSFRDHWMWYNGFFSNEEYITFIIWKDYNCFVWTTIGIAGVGGLSRQPVHTALVGVNDVNPNTDIWGKTKKFMNNLVKQAGYSGDDKAFTIIASEYWNTYHIGRACLAASNAYLTTTQLNELYSATYGSIVVLQMR